MNERDILERLESVVDRWLRANPTERAILIHEKIRLEEMLDDLRRAKTA